VQQAAFGLRLWTCKTNYVKSGASTHQNFAKKQNSRCEKNLSIAATLLCNYQTWCFTASKSPVQLDTAIRLNKPPFQFGTIRSGCHHHQPPILVATDRRRYLRKTSPGICKRAKPRLICSWVNRSAESRMAARLWCCRDGQPLFGEGVKTVQWHHLDVITIYSAFAQPVCLTRTRHIKTNILFSSKASQRKTFWFLWASVSWGGVKTLQQIQSRIKCWRVWKRELNWWGRWSGTALASRVENNGKREGFHRWSKSLVILI